MLASKKFFKSCENYHMTEQKIAPRNEHSHLCWWLQMDRYWTNLVPVLYQVLYHTTLIKIGPLPWFLHTWHQPSHIEYVGLLCDMRYESTISGLSRSSLRRIKVVLLLILRYYSSEDLKSDEEFWIYVMTDSSDLHHGMASIDYPTCYGICEDCDIDYCCDYLFGEYSTAVMKRYHCKNNKYSAIEDHLSFIIVLRRSKIWGVTK